MPQDKTPPPPPPIGIAFDTGMARISDALALAMLYGFNGKKEARLLAVSVSASNLNAAAYCEVVGEFYAGAVSGAFGGAARTLPVGLSTSGKLPGDSPLFTAPMMRQEGGKPVYNRVIRKMNDTADPVAVIRNALTTQTDHNAIVLACGPATTLAQLLALHGARDIATQKAKLLVLAAGAYPEGPADPYVTADIPAMRKLLAEWPTPIVACGSEVGAALPFPGSSIDKDFAWAKAHPVVDAYRAYRAMPYDATSESMAAALYAAHSTSGFFKLSEPGVIDVTPEGRTKFTPSADGRHRYLIVDPAQREAVIHVFTTMASARPVSRRAAEAAETEVVHLWEKGAPGSEGKTAPEKVRVAEPGGDHVITSVHKPSITVYFADKPNGAAVVIAPGGGHRELWADHEGHNVAHWLAQHGVTGMVLKYRLAREEGSTYTVEGHALADTQRAIRVARSNARDWGINPEHIGVMGFSAGGELAALAASRYDAPVPANPDDVDHVSAKPAFQALIYPAIPENMKLSKETPPAFLLCGEDDRQNISQGLPELYLAMKKAGVSAELHVLAGVGHGFGVRDSNKGETAAWLMRFYEWLETEGMTKRR